MQPQDYLFGKQAKLATLLVHLPSIVARLFFWDYLLGVKKS